MKKILSLILALAMCTCVCFMFTSCGEEEHEHEWEEKYSKNETYHWHACEDEECDEKFSKEKHVWTNVDGVETCATCKATQGSDDTGAKNTPTPSSTVPEKQPVIAVTPTPRPAVTPAPAPIIPDYDDNDEYEDTDALCDITNEQLNNYYTKYTIASFTSAGETIEYYEFIEVGYANIILLSDDGGETFYPYAQDESIFSYNYNYVAAHLYFYEDERLLTGENVIAGKNCMQYYCDDGVASGTVWIDKSFNTTGMTLKSSITEDGVVDYFEVKEIKFDVINKVPGYEFSSFNIVNEDI